MACWLGPSLTRGSSETETETWPRSRREVAMTSWKRLWLPLEEPAGVPLGLEPN